MKSFPPDRDFSSLSVRDLLEAREAYHLHLAHLEHVVGTAIGRYRIRAEDPDAKSSRKQSRRSYGADEKRTLANTIVKPWSWPAVIVFVDEWVPLEKFHKKPDQVVPRALYLPDGRVVPTCVIYAARDDSPAAEVDRFQFSSSLLGGGYPVLTEVQGTEHIGSIGCLVTDGDTTYALTNRHVTGELHSRIYTLVRGEREFVGMSSGSQLGKKPFCKVYEGWPGADTFVDLDAALVKIEDVNQWTAQVFGIGELGQVADLNTDTTTLDLIGCPVRAFGGVSGVLEGEIQALFYRYRSVGGFDYVADLLIGPRGRAKLTTRPGDSGTMWFFDPPSGKRKPAEGSTRNSGGSEIARGEMARRLRPVALQWGGGKLRGSEEEQPTPFALATLTATVCRMLDVDIIQDWNIGHSEYWGKIAHFKIGAAACDLLAEPKLRKLMGNNVERIGFPDRELAKGSAFRVGRHGFVPLADVPDYVWIAAAHGQSSGDGPADSRSARANEGPQHFADMDQKGKGKFAGKTLLDLCGNPDNISADVWRDYYAGFKKKGPDPGALPFRTWQIYESMVRAAKAGDAMGFVGAAGVLSHYVGDACQPLHVSHLHHGHAPTDDKKSDAYKAYKKTAAYKVHAIYEEGMFEARPAEALQGINEAVKGMSAKADVKSGYEAARSVVDLMRTSIDGLRPDFIIKTDELDETAKNRASHFWEKLGAKTVKLIAGGCLRLACLWESAWREGNGAKNVTRLDAISEPVLQNLYRRNDFLPALTFDEMVRAGYIAPNSRSPKRRNAATTPRRKKR